MLFVAVIFGEQMLLLCNVCFIEVINNNWIDAKYCQMAFQSVLVHLPEILEESLFGTPGQMKVMQI